MKHIVVIWILLFSYLFSPANAQIKTSWIDTTTHSSRDNAFLFTNRPPIMRKDGPRNFKNKFTKQTDNLYFCLFNYDEDSIYIKYKAENTSKKYLYDDLTVNLMCSSMGNQLLKKYLQKRKKQGIPLVKIYNRIIFMGSDVSWDSFEEGKGFHNKHQLTDSVNVYVHAKDLPLKFSQILNPKQRMGLAGSKKAEQLPGFIKIYNVTDMIGHEYLRGLGHDYLLRNPILREQFINYQNQVNK